METTSTQGIGSTGAETVGDRLARLRRRRFVGRRGELALFAEAMEAAEPPFAVLFIHGPGGVGKTTLLMRLSDLARGAGREVIQIDFGTIDPHPAAVLDELGRALGLGQGEPALGILRHGPRRVLVLDRFEAAGPVDGWIRESLLPGLADGTLTLIAARSGPSRAWLNDPGWRELVRAVSLRNLAPDEARAYLHRAGVPRSMHARALGLSHGHPLALSMMCELVAQRGAGEAALPRDLGDEPDLVGSLLTAFLDHTANQVQRQALLACAHARFTTEDLLQEALDDGDAGELFEWLRALSFVEEGAHGIFPHDLARDVLEADMRWRDPASFKELHDRISAHTWRRARQSDGPERQRAITDWIFLSRSNPFTVPYYQWKTYGSVYYDRFRSSDRDALLEIAALHEGPESRELVAHWLDLQPDAFRVVRGGDLRPLAFGAILALHRAAEKDIAADPGTAAMWAYAQGHGAPRAGEEVFASRFCIDREAYQGPSASYSAMTAAWTEHLLSRSRPSWDFIGQWADPDRIEPFMEFIDFHRVPEADFEVGGRRYGVFAHDWRQVGLQDWLELSVRRQAARGFDPGATSAPPPVVALSAPEFAEAVGSALRDLHRPDALAANPLMDARLVREARSGAPLEALRDLIEEAVNDLRTDPRDEKLHRVLVRTYLRPAPTQELAAAALDLPLSTYKRHRKRGVERVAGWLWQRELYGLQA